MKPNMSEQVYMLNQHKTVERKHTFKKNENKIQNK